MHKKRDLLNDDVSQEDFSELIREFGSIISKKAARQLFLQPQEKTVSFSDATATTLGKLLRQLREEAGLSRRELAIKGGVKDTTLTLLENGVLDSEEIPVRDINNLVQVLLKVDEVFIDKIRVVHDLDDSVTEHVGETRRESVDLTYSDYEMPQSRAQMKDEKNNLGLEAFDCLQTIIAIQSLHQPIPETEQPLSTILKSTIVRIKSAEQFIGIGFLVPGRRVLACGNIVNDTPDISPNKLEESPISVLLDFPFVAPNVNMTAWVAYWDPETGATGLLLQGLPPDGAEAAPLITIDDLQNEQVQVIEFADAFQNNKLVNGVLYHQRDSEKVKIRNIKQTKDGHFCGGPVWSEEIGGVVGMVSSDDTFIIPTSTLVRHWPDLSEMGVEVDNLHLAQLHKFIVENYSLRQLPTLCVTLNVPYTKLAGLDIYGKTSSLLKWMQAKNTLRCLRYHLKERFGAFVEDFFPLDTMSPHVPGENYRAVPPAPPDNFIGHTELLNKIKEMLSSERKNKRIVLHGQQGVGKTAIAARIVEEFRNDLFEDVLWSSLSHQNGNVRSILIAWARSCQSDNVIGQTNEKLANTVKELLTQRMRSNRHLLIVIDDIQKKWLPASEQLKCAVPDGASLIFTTREKDVAQKLDAKLYEVKAFSEDYALALLKKYFASKRIEARPDKTKILLNAIGYLPLAIELVGKYLNQLKVYSPYTISHIFQDMQYPPKKASELQYNLQTLFQRCYLELNEEAQRLFRCLSVFASGSIRLESIAGVAGLELTEAETILDDLVALSFVSKDHKSQTYKRYIIHALLQDYARNSNDLSPEEYEMFRKAHLDYYLAFAKINARIDREAHDELEAVLPNLLSAFDYAVEIKDHHSVRQFGLALCVESQFLTICGYADETIYILPEVLAVCQALGYRSDLGNILGCLGIAHEYLDEKQTAIEYYEEARMICQDIRQRLDEGIWLERLGNTYRSLGRVDKAHECFQKALSIYRSEGDQRLIGRGLGNLGNLYNDRGQEEEAIQYFEEALRIASNDIVEDEVGQALSLARLGLVYRYSGNIPKAIKYFQTALLLHENSTIDKNEKCSLLLDIGLAYYNLGEIEIAEGYFEDALNLSREIGYLSGEASALGHLGLVNRHRGKLYDAKKLFEQALDIVRIPGNNFRDRRREADMLANLGVIHRYLGDNNKAIHLHEEALEIRQVIGDRRGEGASLGNLGISYLNLGQVDKAIHYLKQALKISREVGERRSQENALASLARAYRHKGRILKSVEYYTQALAISRNISHQRHVANRLGRLGNDQRKLGQLDKAEKNLKEALELSKKIKNKGGEGDHEGYLGLVYLALDKLKEAKRHLERALSISQELGKQRKEGILWGHLACVYYKKGDYETAIKYLEKGRHISLEVGDKRHVGEHVSNLGLVYHDLYQLEKAILHYEMALTLYDKEVGDQIKVGTSLLRLGNAHYDLGEVGRASDYYEKTLDIYRKIGFLRGESKVLSGLGSIYLNQGDLDLAIDHLTRALNIGREYAFPRDLASLLGKLGVTYSRLDDCEQAIKNVYEARDISRKIGYLRGQGEQLSNLGEVYHNLGQDQLALKHLQDALAIDREVRNYGDEIRTLIRLGDVYLTQKQFHQASDWYQSALSLCKEFGRSFLEKQVQERRKMIR